MNKYRCSWCNHILWPWQDKSVGRTLHIRCLYIVNRIQATTQEQYWARQAELRYKEEDRL